MNLEFSSPIKKSVEIVWRAKDVVSMEDIAKGKEYVEKCEENRIILKKGIVKGEFMIK